MEYEWVKTATGWRIFWGVDPLAIAPKASSAATTEEGGTRCVLAPGREAEAREREATCLSTASQA